MKEVILKKEGSSGQIILNRPDKLNSLNHDMILAIDEKLKEWAEDSEILTVVMYGSGDRGFCAGGDMRVYYDNKERAHEIARDFFSSEYEMDQLLINYPKPLIAWLDGIVMGGGVGISYGADFRLVTEKTKWSMPEVNIGFYPDVGGSWFLNKISREMGLYISLMASFLKAADVIWLGLAEMQIDRQAFEGILKEISKVQGQSQEAIKEEIGQILKTHIQEPGLSYLEEHEAEIKKYFSGDSMEAILASLEEGKNEGHEWASTTLKELRKKSLLSQYVIFEQLKRAKDMTLAQCFEMELIMSINFMDNPDFFEGLRSVLVDKDEPNWTYKNPEDISKELVASFFEE